MCKSGQIHNAPDIEARCVKSGLVHACNPAFFHVAQSGEIQTPFSPLRAPETMEKPAVR